MKFRAVTIDRIYIWLGYFTSLYLVLSAVEFFSNLHLTHPVVEHTLDALSEPYLSALAIYVVLKELRKRRGVFSLHRGERFVAAWVVLLAATTLAVMFTDTYHFDLAYHLILSNSLASLVIYLGSQLHRP
ncbi:MAG: hypothetical protein Q8R35_00705 [bacterium]|nr:hypothetical protein [bacterium]